MAKLKHVKRSLILSFLQYLMVNLPSLSSLNPYISWGIFTVSFLVLICFSYNFHIFIRIIILIHPVILIVVSKLTYLIFLSRLFTFLSTLNDISYNFIDIHSVLVSPRIHKHHNMLGFSFNPLISCFSCQLSRQKVLIPMLTLSFFLNYSVYVTFSRMTN